MEAYLLLQNSFNDAVGGEEYLRSLNDRRLVLLPDWLGVISKVH